MKYKKPAEKIEHLNLALRAIRNVNRLLVKERDRDHLITAICNVLVENRGYQNAWIAVLDDNGALITAAESGPAGSVTITEHLKGGHLTACAQTALTRSEAVFIKNPLTSCRECPFAEKYSYWGAITVRLEYDGKVYGILSVSIPRELVSDDVEQSLVSEIAEDIAFGLRRIDLEQKHKKADADLKERVSELNCLFELSRLVENRDKTIGEILQEIVDLIPSTIQSPEITCAKIETGDAVFQTVNYRDTAWKISCPVSVNEKPEGALTVCYREDTGGECGASFPETQDKFINSVAMRVGKIIERKRDRKALEESEKRFRDLINNSVTGISIIQDEEVIYQNPAQEELFGPMPRSFKLKADDEIHPDDVDKVRRFYARLMSGKKRTADTDFRIYPPGKDGKEMKWIYCRASIIDYNERDAILVNMIDITRLRELEHLLKIQDKMTSLGRVAAGIAHEIRNPLSGFNIYITTLEKLIERCGDSEKIRKIFTQLHSASQKIESIIKRVMDFSKPGAPRFVLTDINHSIEEAFTLSAVTLRQSGVRIKKNLDPDLPPCNADPHMIEQVILNLITNAAEAMKNMEAEKKLEISSSAENGFVRITVSDSGPGIPQNHVDNIFDPFYTTKNNSSGIGLSICQRIIADHGGSMGVSKGRWGGAEFSVSIPVNRGAYKK